MEVLRKKLVSCGYATARSVFSTGPAGHARRWASTTPTEEGEKNDIEAGEEGGGGGGGGDVWPRRVVSGLQPTGALHVGNYFGALRRCVRAQDRGDDLMLFVADLHALTTSHDASSLQEHSLQLTALALAAGVDPERSVLFAQSAVPRHAELCWLLACLCTQARVHHLPQYREKAAALGAGAAGAGAGAAGAGAGAGAGGVPLGLLLYPVLQAADVLLYRGTHVPVGADQQHHLQLAALLARTFAHRYGGGAFPAPRAWLPDDGSDRIRSLRAPLRKMSKSDRDARAAILLSDSDAAIRLKLRKAVTDCEPRVSFDPAARPGVSNLVTLHCLAADKLPEEVVEESAGLTTAQYKAVVAEALCEVVRPLRERAARWLERPRALRDVLRQGAARARRRADRTYEEVARRAGLAPPAAAAPPAHALRLPPAPSPAPSPDPARRHLARS